MSKMEDTLIIPSLTKGIVTNRVLVETLKTALDLVSGHQKNYLRLKMISTVLGLTSATTSVALIFTSWSVTSTTHSSSSILLISAFGGLAGIGSACLSFRNLINTYKVSQVIEPKIRNCLEIFDRDNLQLREELEKIPQVLHDLENIGYDLGQLVTMTAPLILGSSTETDDGASKIDQVTTTTKLFPNDQLVDQNDERDSTLVTNNNEDKLAHQLTQAICSTCTLIGGLCIFPYAKIGLMMRDYYDMVMSLSYTQLTTTESLFRWTRKGVLIGVIAVVYGNFSVERDFKKTHPLSAPITQFISVLEEDCKDKQNLLCLLRLWEQSPFNE